MPGRSWSLLLPLLVMLALTGCGAVSPILSDGEVRQTAVAQGCWPDTRRSTPMPVTVTVPGGTPTATATRVANFGDPTYTPAPTATNRATTTPMPFCTPAPGETQLPTFTPWPTQPPFPTMPVNGSQPQAGNVEVMRLPNAVLVSDLAVHPNSSWPAVTAIDIPVSTKGDARIYARVFNPKLRTWALAHTVDRDGSHPGDRFRSVAIGVSPDDTAHIVWGATTYPKMELFYARSSDYGETWSAPESLGGQYFSVADVATAPNNDLYALVFQPRERVVAAVLFHRTAAGVWSKEDLPGGAFWYASSGALTVLGDGDNARLVVMATTDNSRPGGAITFSRPLHGGAWTSELHTTTDAEGMLGHAAVVAYPYNVGNEQREGITFSAILRDSGNMYAVTSLDGGTTWGTFAPIVRTSGLITSGGISFDASAQRLVSVWNCCGDAAWGNAEATHYAAWASPFGGTWSPEPGKPPAGRTPLVTGASSAAVTMIANAINAQSAWVAWVEDGQLVRARSFTLSRIIPSDQYPSPTTQASPTRTGGQP